VADSIGLPKDAAGRWLAIAPLDHAGNMAKPRFVRITASEPAK
jgi:hypothetical protein